MLRQVQPHHGLEGNLTSYHLRCCRSVVRQAPALRQRLADSRADVERLSGQLAAADMERRNLAQQVCVCIC